MADSTKAERIAALNDALRRQGTGGRFMVTRGVADRGEVFIAQALAQVCAFDAFTEDNDPYGERDFGSFDLEGAKLFWKVDYYHPTLTEASPDPADQARTVRVLTVMLANEY